MNLDKRVSGSTLLTGIIGDPVEHSVSPVLQNSLFTALNINGIYVPMKVPKPSLKDAISGLKATGFKGFNVTMPHKKAVMEYLDEISEEAAMLGSVNTVKISGDRLYGYNTDGYGFVRSFHEQTGSRFDGKTVCVIGAGDTARALTLKIGMEGAGKIYIINRTVSKATELAAEVSAVLSGMKCRCSVSFAEAGSAVAEKMLKECDIIVNTTPVGMYPDTDFSPVKDDFEFHEKQIVYDVIYNPSKTKLIRHAEKCGCVAVNGATMLFYQGIMAFEIWMETEIPLSVTKDLLAEFNKYINLKCME